MLVLSAVDQFRDVKQGVTRGRSAPLGATPTHAGTNFSIFSPYCFGRGLGRHSFAANVGSGQTSRSLPGRRYPHIVRGQNLRIGEFGLHVDVLETGFVFRHR
jgi:hypothetical protein